MSRSRTTVAGMTLCGALVASGLLTSPAANATAASQTSQVRLDETALGSEITTDTMLQAIAEARAADAVTGERVNADGTRIVVIGLGDGATLELSDPRSGTRMATGSDAYGGMYVAFNSFDQNLIISGGMTAVAAAACLLGPAVCAVATVACLLASTAIGSSGGVQCGTKSLRVYPISHKTPRCAA